MRCCRAKLRFVRPEEFARSTGTNGVPGITIDINIAASAGAGAVVVVMRVPSAVCGVASVVAEFMVRSM
jgi:hypothetical protein